MGEIRNARCLLLQDWWLQYADHRVVPICRSWPGSITPITHWILYADPQVDPLGRSLTLCCWLIKDTPAIGSAPFSRTR